MPEYSGANKIGFLLGGGAKQMKQQAFEEGRLNTARTEDALATARIKQLEATAKAEQERQFQSIGDEIARAGGTDAALRVAIMKAGRGNADQLQNAMLGFQEQDFRTTLGDPESDPETAFAAGQGVQGKVLSPYDMVGANDYTDLRSGATDLLQTPTGAAGTKKNEAQAALYDERRTNPQRFLAPTGGAGGVKPPSGFMLNPDFDEAAPEGETNTRLRAITGGPQDPNTPGKLGVRERQVVARVTNAAFNTANDLENLMSIPSSASTGFLGTGVGAAPGVSVLDATAGQLKYALAPDEVRDYQRILAGLSRQMLALEAMGMAGTEAMAESYDALMFRKYDTIEDKMMALALMRQTTENGLRTLITINPLSATSKRELASTMQRMAAAVPFTVEDVLALRYGKRETLGQAVGTAGLPAASPEATPVAAPAPGTRRMGKNGIEYEFGGGDPADRDNWYPVAK
jgi:hypothetical protein